MSEPTGVSVGRLHQVAQRATDLDRSIEFYRERLGGRFVARFDPPGLAFFDFDGVRLLLEAGAPGATLYFWVDDIAEAHDQLQRRGVEFVAEPSLVHKDDGGLFGPAGAEEWMAFFRDPDANLLAIASCRTG